MTPVRSLWLAFGAAIALHPAPLRAQDAAINRELDAWYREASHRAPGEWGVVVADPDGRVIWQVNGDRPMLPASTVKLFTTGFARTVLGGDAHRSTRVLGTGTLDAETGHWNGTWALELNGDPTLGRPAVAGPTLTSLAQQLRAIGVRRIDGPLRLTTQVGDATAAYPAVWSSRHRGRSFAPPVGPVTINENVVGFAVGPGSRPGESAVLTGEAPSGIAGLIQNEARTVNGSRIRLRARRSGHGWVVTGTIGVKARTRGWTFVAHDPEAVVGAVWSRALWKAGIDWEADSIPSHEQAAPQQPRVLAAIASPPFDSIAHEVNTRSVNIGAELLLEWAARGRPDGPEQLEEHVRDVTGIKQGIELVDGSGLSDTDRVAPIVFTTYLANFPRTLHGRNFPLLLPANGKGTLKKLAQGLPAEGVVRAKTGTLGDAVTLVGYLGHTDGMLLVAVMYSGKRLTRARAEQWKLFRSLGADGTVILPTGLPGMVQAASVNAGK